MGVRHIPILRFGEPYSSLDTAEITHIQTGETAALISMANPGLIRRDLQMNAPHHPLRSVSTQQLLSWCMEAGRSFLEDTLPLGDGTDADPQRFVDCLSSTTGLPEVHCHKGMQKIHRVLTEMEAVLAGLTGGLSPADLDQRWSPAVDCLGAVMPSNAPGVHTLWLPAIALKTSVALKPGGLDPWTPFRIIQAFLHAGVPAGAFGFYPTTHEGAQALLLSAERGMIFGDAATVAPWNENPEVEVHGPGRSKIVFGADQANRWEDHLELLIESIAGGGGRSCLNASAILTTDHADELTEALARRFATMEGKGLQDPDAFLSGFPSPDTVAALDTRIDTLLSVEGVTDATAAYRPKGRRASVDGMHFLLPTVVRCEKADHPLAQTEFPFPFVAITEVTPEELATAIKDTLICTVISENTALLETMEESPEIERVNRGPIPTNQLSWDRPLEGNLFELLSGKDASAKESAP